MAILGGDVLFLNQEGEIDITHDNWYCNQREEKSDGEYLDRSIALSKIYVSEYKNNLYKNCTFLFDLVLENYNYKPKLL